MAYETIGEGASEHFVEDRDTVYCKHGQFIGYPGGADFICGACEDGLDELVPQGRWRVAVHQKDEWFKYGDTLGFAYSLQALQDKYSGCFELPRFSEMWFTVEYEVIQVWQRREDD